MKLRNLLILSFFSSNLVVVLIVWISISKMYLTDYEGYLLIGITILANVLGALLGLFLLRNTVHSLDKLSHYTQSIKEKDFKKIQLRQAPKEVQSLASNYNEMVTDLAQSFEALEKSEQDKNNLIAQLGHDIKTPITAIKSQIEAIQDGIIPEEEISQTLTQMAYQIERLNYLTKQLMEVAIMERNEMDPLNSPKQKIWLDQFLVTLFSSFDYSMRKKDQRLEVQVDPQIKTIMTDEGKLNRILANLIENASKYSPSQTRITLTIRNENQQILFSVRDEGEGIAAENQEKIFDRLYRVEESRNQATGGSGLGLYISRNLAKQLGGTLTVKSTKGAGSDFQLSLPAESLRT